MLCFCERKSDFWKNVKSHDNIQVWYIYTAYPPTFCIASKSRVLGAMFVCVCVQACEFYILIMAESEPPLAGKCVWISMCVVLLVFWAPFCLCSWGKISENDRTWGDPTMAKDTYCVGRTDTHVHNKQMHTHTHTTSASVGIPVCPVSVCVILRDTFVSAWSQSLLLCLWSLRNTHWAHIILWFLRPYTLNLNMKRHSQLILLV